MEGRPEKMAKPNRMNQIAKSGLDYLPMVDIRNQEQSREVNNKQRPNQTHFDKTIHSASIVSMCPSREQIAAGTMIWRFIADIPVPAFQQAER